MSFFPFAWPSSTPAPPSEPVVDHVPGETGSVTEELCGSNTHKIEHLYVRQAETRREENGSKLYIVYRIELHGPVRIWSVWRRYSEFDQLHAKLCALSPDGGRTLPPGKLPPKTYFFSTVNSAVATEERRKALEVWLRGILQARDPRWRESQAWCEFLAIPASRNTSFPAATPSPNARRSSCFTKAFTSESWLDEANELSTLARQIRALLNRRDALLVKGEAVQAASASSQARSLLTTFGTRFGALQTGLQVFAPIENGGCGDQSLSSTGRTGHALILSEGEYTRRNDMVQRLKDERDALSKLAVDTIHAATAWPAGSSPASAADRNALLSTSSTQQSNQPFQFRAGGRNSIWGEERLLSSTSAATSRRVFGGPAPPPQQVEETEATRQLDNGGLLQLQQRIMDKQDEHVQGLSALLNRQKQIGLSIGNELENQNALLVELDAHVDTTQGKLKFAQSKLKRMQK